MEGTSAKTLAIAAIIVSVIMLALWLGIGSSVAAPMSAMGVSEAKQAPVISLEATGLGSGDELSDSPLPKRARTEPGGHSNGDLSDTALAGRVIDPDGRPVAYAGVALLVIGPDGPDKELKTYVETSEDGSFVLEPLAGIRGRTLVLIARESGFRPVCIPIQIDTEVRQQELELQLERGYSITGRVVRDGDPVAGVMVDVDLRWKARGIHGIGTDAFWIDGRLEEKEVYATTDLAGRFRLTGLSQNEYRLEARDGYPSVHESIQEVWAPTDDLEIDITPGRLVITVRRDGRAVSGAWIQAGRASSDGEVRSRADQPTVIAVRAGSEVRIRVDHDGSKTAQRTVTALERGERAAIVIDLTAVDRPAIRLRLLGPGTKSITQLEVQVLGQPWTTARLLRRVGNREYFEWTVPFPERRYKLVIGPREGTSSQYLLETSQEVTLTKGVVLDVIMTPQIGGLFQFDIARLDRRMVVGNAHLSSDAGAEVWSQSWDGFGHGGGRRFSSSSSHGLPSPKAFKHQDYKSLVPGKYRLVVEAEGLDKIDREVLIRPGVTTKEQVRF